MRTLFWLFFFFLFCGLQAQDYVDLAKFHYQSTGDNKFDSSNNTTKIDELSLDVTLPLKLNDKTAILTGFAINKFTMDLTEFGDNTSVSSYLLKAGLNINHNEKWNGTYLLLPKLASDFVGESQSQDFQIAAAALLKYQKNPNMRYKIGLYYNSEIFGTFIVPLFGFYYKKNKFEANLTLPSVADANYRLNDNLFVGMNFRGVVKTFNLTQSYQSLGQEYLGRNTNEVMAYLGYEFNNGLIIKGQIGYSIARSYRIYEENDKMDWAISVFRFGDDRVQLNSDFADGLLFRAQMVYRFHLD